MKSQTSINSQLKLYFFLAAFIVGLIHVWVLRYYIDDISYLDIGEEIFNGNLKTLINGFASPLYAVIIGFFLFLFKPSIYLESTLIHFINFLIFLISFFCFDFFLQELIKYHKKREATLAKNNLIGLPEWAWLVLGYLLFIWSSMNSLLISFVAPDVCVSAFVYLAGGLLLKIKLKPRWHLCFLLGLVLGFGYLSKTAMFLISFLFIFSVIFIPNNLLKGLLYGFISLATFCLISGPFVYLLSKSKGYFSYGESGRLNYTWETNENNCWCFDPGFPGCNGKLKHPVKEIFQNPTVFEYSTPFNVTYPPDYDPSYWCDGTVPYFDFRGQYRTLTRTGKDYFDLFFGKQSGLIVICLMLFLIGSRRKTFLEDLKNEWVIILPAIGGMGLYALVHVEFRYICAFFVIFWLGLFSAVKLPNTNETKKIISSVIFALGIVLFVTSVFSQDFLINRMTSFRDRDNITIADYFKSIGIQKGDKVALFGVYEELHWARLLKARIVGEMPEEETHKFWASDENIKSKVFQALRNVGVKLIFSGTTPDNATGMGWKNVTGTPYYYYVL